MLKRIHHAAIICSDYARSKAFYTEVLGLETVAENYRAARDSYKLDLALPDRSQIELFSFPDSPQRPSYPEAQGIHVEPVRIDEYTGRAYTFFQDPDGLPLELYQA
ncbi:VOC family protein [Vibrio furnissii]|uniref:VOC family protein n=1 Tax=Vibrio furnissii TaxID=29494 RepID=UPI0024BACC77|nr:VOC family protein [Vibrio furnissii]WHR54150.1 VOC family protein [Vibrio furnissii]